MTYQTKYELTNTTKDHFGITLYQIKALKDFGGVKTGDLGGWVASEKNLSQEGNCWVYGNANVYGNAEVHDNAEVYGDARVHGNAWVCGNARVHGGARVHGNAWVCGNAKVHGNVEVKRGKYLKTPTSITRSDGYAFTLQQDLSIVAGCRDFDKKRSEEYWGDPKHHMHKESWTIVQALWAIQETKG